MNPPQVDPGQRTNERLAGEDADGGGHFAQVIDATEDAAVSTLTPIQTFFGQGSFAASLRTRSLRFVNT